MNVRWLWRPSQLALEHKDAPEDSFESCAPNEVFYTDTTTEISTDCIEGYCLRSVPSPHAQWL